MEELSLRRLRIAEEAARLMLEEYIHDYAAAKRKAVASLDFEPRTCLPNNREIQNQILARRRLFDDRESLFWLQRLREDALNAMKDFHEYSPRLTGAVLNGTATPYSRVMIHVFPEGNESFLFDLIDRGYPYRESEKTYKQHRGVVRFPSVLLHRGETMVEFVVFPFDGLRLAPISPVDGRPMRRADIKEVQFLVSSHLDDIFGLAPEIGLAGNLQAKF